MSEAKQPIPKSEAKVRNKKEKFNLGDIMSKRRKITIALILFGYFAVFLLTFIFMGGLEALIEFATDASKALEDIIRELIERLGGFLP